MDDWLTRLLHFPVRRRAAEDRRVGTQPRRPLTSDDLGSHANAELTEAGCPMAAG
jgi:hypothetical protein